MKKIAIAAVLSLLAINYLVYMYELIRPGPECLVNDCERKVKEGCEFCRMHHNALEGTSHVCGELNKIIHRDSDEDETESVTSSNNYSDTSSNKTSSTYKPSTTKKPSSTRKPSGSNKGYDSHNSYDAGYEDVYENDDYDWDRYYSDDDYANGVDDAMDELDW